MTLKLLAGRGKIGEITSEDKWEGNQKETLEEWQKNLTPYLGKRIMLCGEKNIRYSGNLTWVKLEPYNHAGDLGILVHLTEIKPAMGDLTAFHYWIGTWKIGVEE